MKKLISLVLALMMVVGMMGIALAADPEYSITITNSNTNMSIIGKTYTAYKLFDVTYDGTNYAYSIKTNNPFYSNEAAKAVLDTYFDFTDVAGDATVKTVTVKEAKQDATTKTLNATNVRALADALQPYATGDGAGSVKATAETAKIDLTEAGYYIVTGTVKPTDPENSDKEVVSAIILDNADPAATVSPKASVPPLDKKITGVTEDGNTLDANGQAAVAKVGATVSYELDSKVPDLTGYTKYTFKFTDNITAGLDYVKTSFKLKIGDGEATTITPTFAEGDKSFTYSIAFADFQAYLAVNGHNPGDAIVLTYDCTVNSNAITYDFEKNTAKLTYSHSPYDNVENDTPEKDTYVIDLNLDVDKIDGSDSTKHLDGAEFKLYRNAEVPLEAGDEGYNEDPEQNGKKTVKQYYKWVNNKVTWVNTQEAGDKFTTTNTGKLDQQVRGLDDGTYYFEEIKAPTGYNLLKDPVTVVITATPDSTTDVKKVTYTATYGGEAATMTNNEVDVTAATQTSGKQPVATGTIENNSGVELPSTGGIGTTLFYVIGACLVLGAGVLLVTKRKMTVK